MNPSSEGPLLNAAVMTAALARDTDHPGFVIMARRGWMKPPALEDLGRDDLESGE